jgi:hypothetical protein
MIDVPLDGEAACSQNRTEPFAKITVREIAARQAARS